MALLFTDGFECYGLATEGAYSGGGNSTRWVSTQGYVNASIYRTAQPTVANSRSYMTSGTSFYMILQVPTSPEIIIGFGYYFNIAVQSQFVYLGKTMSAYPTDGFYLQRLANNALRIFLPNGTSYTSAANVITALSWSYIEIRTVFHATLGAVEVRVEGASVISQSSIDTTGSGLTGITYISLSGTADTTYMDDFYVVDSTGTINNTFLGPSSVFTLLPDGDASAGLTTAVGGSGTHASCVNEATPNGDTSYVSSVVTGQADYFTMQNLPINGTVRGVQVTTRTRKTDNGVRNFKIFTQVSATPSTPVVRAAVHGSNYITDYGVFDYQPDGVTAWTPAAVNAMETGIELA